MITVDGTGVTYSSLAETVQELEGRVRDAIGADLSLSPQTPQGQILGIDALGLEELYEAIAANELAIDPDRATGTQLDQLYGALNIERIVATRSLVTATLAGVAGTGVPALSRARTADGSEFRTIADAVLSPSGVSVEMESVEEGPVMAAAGALTRIVTIVPGWETATNAEAATPGIARQDDATYRASAFARTARNAIGPMDAFKSALEEAMAGKTAVHENSTATAVIIQEYSIAPHSLFVIAQTGTNAEITRAIEQHRGMGVGTVTAIKGGAPDNSGLDAITNGTVTWNGTAYTGLDLSAASTPAAKATALTTLLETDPTPPTVRYIDDRYVAMFAWMPSLAPDFAQASVEQLFALDPQDSTYPPGPFIRPTGNALTVSLTLTRRSGFAADGLNLVRTAILDRVLAYDLGEELWLNDLLAAAENVPGTRITLLSVQHSGSDVSGIAQPLDNLWVLAASDLTVTVV